MIAEPSNLVYSENGSGPSTSLGFQKAGFGQGSIPCLLETGVPPLLTSAYTCSATKWPKMSNASVIEMYCLLIVLKN